MHEIKREGYVWCEMMGYQHPLKMRIQIDMSLPMTELDDVFDIKYNSQSNEMFRYLKTSTN
jgi:hypothetical protein